MRVLSLLLVPFLLNVAGTMATAAEPPRPNILFILSDDHSYPFVGCYGDTNVRTPALDQFAAEGIKFHRFFTTAPQCVPSRASLLTGRSAVAARITRFSSPLARDEITFPEVLREKAGYFTGVCGRSYHLDGSAGNRGDAIGQLLEKHGLRTFEQRLDYVKQGSDKQALEQMKEFLDRRPEGKSFCLWLNFSDPHHPWNAPDSDRPDAASLKLPPHWPDLPGMRKQLADYCAEVNRLDRSVQGVLQLLAARGLAQNTLVVFVGDNGAALPHGKGSLYDPGCNVPFIVRWPGVVKPGGESRSLLSGEDLAPTLLAAAGVPIPTKMTGVSFLPLLRGKHFTPSKYLFAERGQDSLKHECGAAGRADRERVVARLDLRGRERELGGADEGALDGHALELREVSFGCEIISEQMIGLSASAAGVSRQIDLCETCYCHRQTGMIDCTKRWQ